VQGLDPDLRSYLDRVVSILQDRLGAELIGVYLHGSLAMGAFDPGRSDVDVLAVCAAPLSRERSMAVGEALAAIPRPTSGGDLESSLVTEPAVRTPSGAPSFEVHVSTHEEPSVVDGHDRPGDEDLVIHFAMARARGRALVGPEPIELFPEPERASLIRAFLSDIDRARGHGAAGWEGHRMPEFASMAYRVLNAARSWRYLESGDLGSKGRGRGLARAPGPGSRSPCAARRGSGVPAWRHARAPGRPDGRCIHRSGGGHAPQRDR
jgi:nucleotidyltransferase-like protein